MTETPVKRLIPALAVPTIISMLVTTFYNMADTFFVGKLSTAATGAVGVVFSFMAILQAVGFMFGQGSGTYISQKLGEKRIKEAAMMCATGFYSSLITGIIIMILGLVFLEPLSRILGATDTILPYAKAYLSIILLGSPAVTSSLVLNNQLRYQGSAMYAMVGIVTGAVLNIGLDPLFIFVFDMDIYGAALATVISQYVSMLLLWFQARKGGSVRIEFRNFAPNWKNLREILRRGFPSLCRQGLASIATICLNLAAGVYGDAAIAGMSVVSRVSFFVNAALIGFGQGFQPVCGFNYGAGLYRRVKEGFWFCVKAGFVFLVIMGILSYIFAPQVIAVFRKDDPDVIAVGTAALRFMCIAFPLNSWIVICNMFLQSIGKAARASMLAACRQGLFFIPLVFILPALFELKGVEMCQMVSDIFSFAVAIPLTIGVVRNMGRV
ncbi:MAG TPA: MATE family efflux transporter [Candidatus Ornithomonoglobus intestinigallinarum]|uniref:Multidrug export protein MepA n=1 Tax=Candidatus Ornithomonoglobus intestinigallinarum TaxID=2840894 RepID=A0A9D1H5C5_9FIRM|nr:MATE family efflux transporter [Candidatus Ornithomonoglobus intestinigallinarum]